MMQGTVIHSLVDQLFYPIFLKKDFSCIDQYCFSMLDIYPGEWVIVAPEQGDVSLHFIKTAKEMILQNPTVSIWYADEKVTQLGVFADYIAKPEWDLTLLMSSGYVGFPLLIRKELFKNLGLPNAAFETAQWVAFCFEAHSRGYLIRRIPEYGIEYAYQRRNMLKQADLLKVMQTLLPRYLPRFEAKKGLSEMSVSIWRKFETYPDVTIIVPTCQSKGDTDRILILDLLESIEHVHWPKDKITVIIGDDTSAQHIYDKPWSFSLEWHHTARAHGEPFNYAKKMNTLWRLAKTDFIILMNDDITAIKSDWLKALATFALEPDVGGVGARLLFPDGRLQHAGVVCGMMGSCAHPWYRNSPKKRSYQDWAIVQKEWSAVTGAVFATRKSVLLQVNGFDERFVLEYNDIDICLRMKSLGYRIVYNPLAEMIHHEQASRAHIPKNEHCRLFIECWGDTYIANDPAYSPALSKKHYNIKPI